MANIAARVKKQFPSFYMTFLSVVVGFAIEDLVAIVRADSRFYFFNLVALNLWLQAVISLGMAITAWLAYGQVAMARRSVPTPFDIINVVWFCMIIFWVNSTVGTSNYYQWYVACTFYSFGGGLATYFVGNAIKYESEQFRVYTSHIRKPLGPITITIVYGFQFIGLAFLTRAGYLNLAMHTVVSFFIILGLAFYVGVMTYVWRKHLLYSDSSNVRALP